MTLRGAAWIALACAAVLAASCQRQGATAPEESSSESTDVAALEAQQAAEQLAALGGPANAEQRALYSGEFEASGALGGVGAGEGAWELQILSDYVQFTRPGLGQAGGLPGQREFREKGMRLVAGDLTITLRAETCQLPNGVSLPYSAHVLFEGVAYQGCAKQGVSAASRSSWASILPELVPAIDACLARATARPARVTIASEMEDGLVSVRLREADGGRAECLVTANGATVNAYGAIADIDLRNGESDPEFVRAPGPPPSTQPCRSVEPVDAADGGRIGWLVRRSC